MKAMISFSETWYCFLFRVKRRSEVMVNKGFSARNECPELKLPKFQFISTFNETTAYDPLPHEYIHSKDDFRVPDQSIISLLKSFCLSNRLKQQLEKQQIIYLTENILRSSVDHSNYELLVDENTLPRCTQIRNSSKLFRAVSRLACWRYHGRYFKRYLCFVFIW